ADEPGDESLRDGRHQTVDMKDRPAIQPLVPCMAGQNDDAELRAVEKRRSGEPVWWAGKVAAGEESLQAEQHERGDEDDSELRHRRFLTRDIRTRGPFVARQRFARRLSWKKRHMMAVSSGPLASAYG